MKSDDLERLFGEAEERLDRIQAVLKATPSEDLVARAQLFAGRRAETKKLLEQNRQHLYRALVMLAYAVGIRALVVPRSQEMIELFSENWVQIKNTFNGGKMDFPSAIVLEYSAEEFATFCNTTFAVIQVRTHRMLDATDQDAEGMKAIAVKVAEFVGSILGS